MKCFLWLCLFYTAFFGSLNAQTIQDQRRVEQEKREQLRPSENRLIERRELLPEEAETSQQTYFRNLFSKKTATLSDAYTVMLILMAQELPGQSFTDQRDFLKNKNILPADIQKKDNPREPLRKGTMAYMLCKLLDIRGGIWMRLFGITPRYSLRELVYDEIMLPGHPNELVSGKELIFTTTQAANYLAEQQMHWQSANRPQQP